MEEKDTVFIFAGYKDEMEHFLEQNPGLASRVNYNLEYKDYATEELYFMFENKLKKYNFKMEDNIKDIIINVIEKAKSEKNFGNGRFIDNLVQKIIMEHALNIGDSCDLEDLITIRLKDIPDNILEGLTAHTKVKIGF